MSAVWLPILIKALSTALIVVSAAALAEAAGPFWGAIVASLPVSAGPAYVFLAMQHDAEFVAASALSSAVANASTGLFLIVYATQARQRPLWHGLGIAATTWLATSLITRQIAWTPLTALLLNLVVYLGGFRTLGTVATAAPRSGDAMVRRWTDLPVKAAAIAVFVSVVVLASSLLGPEATGIASVFPISLMSVIVISQPRIGRAASALLAANALRAMLGFGLALLALHLAIAPWAIVPALFVGLAVTVSWSGGLLVLRRRVGRRFRHA